MSLTAAELVAIGRAIEQLPTWETWWIESAPDGSLDAEQGRRYGVRVAPSRTWHYGPTLPDAIAAALRATR